MILKPVYILVADLFFATKIVKTAEAMGLQARAFDSADRLAQAAKDKEPAVVIMDCGGLEKEAFRLLEQFRSDGKLSGIPRIGYVAHVAQDLKRQMQGAGCEAVYSKTEFTKGLENLLTRYAHGIPSRI